MIHLKHDLIFEEGSISKVDIEYWRLIAEKRTQCWNLISDDIQYTENIDKVTCIKCLEIINKR